MRTDKMTCAKCGESVSLKGTSQWAIEQSRQQIREHGCIRCRTEAARDAQRAEAERQQRPPMGPPP